MNRRNFLSQVFQAAAGVAVVPALPLANWFAANKPQFNMSGTVTGRLSHRHPNIMSLPRADKYVAGDYIMVVSDGKTWHVLDYHFVADAEL